MYRYLLIVFFGLWLLSCEQDELPVPEREIPRTVRPYLERFIQEAEKRGIFPDTSKLTIEFTDDIRLGDIDQPVIGLCTRTSNLHKVQLDTTNALWLLSGYLGREEIVFHELGHCLLRRAHRDDKFKSGDFASIMRAVGLLQYGDLDRYNTLLSQPTAIKAHRREYYLDELFYEDVPVPCWSDSTQLPPYPVKYYHDEIVAERQYLRMWVDAKDNFWLYGTSGNYLNQDGTFSNQLDGLNVRAMDNATDGNLWIGAEKDQKPLVGTYEQGELVVKYQQDDFPTDFGLINSILLDNQQRVWVCDWAGKLIVNDGSGFQSIELPTTLPVSKMIKGEGDQIYIIQGSAFYILSNAETLEQFDRSNSDFPTSYFSDLAMDNQGVVWLQPRGTNRYLVQLYPDRSVQTVDLNRNLLGVRINSLATGPNRSIWIATTNGIRKWEGSNFSSFCTFNTGLKSLDINELKIGSNGNIWIETKDPETNKNLLILSEVGE